MSKNKNQAYWISVVFSIFVVLVMSYCGVFDNVVEVHQLQTGILLIFLAYIRLTMEDS